MTNNSRVENNAVSPTSDTRREKFAKSIDFVFACCGNCIGFGNVWKFPFLCYKNGGGAFLIPYMLACLIIGIPTFLLESSLGQFMSEGGIKAWKICPLFQGIGLATTVIVFLQSCTYNLILAWVFYYFFSSFTTTLPWSNCNNTWNTNTCMDSLKPSTNFSHVFHAWVHNGKNTTTFTNSSWRNITVSADNLVIMDPVTEFWEHKVLGLSHGIEHLGGIKWDLCLCLLLSWIIVYFVIWKGIKLSGKVIYVTVTAPYVLMVVLFIRGVTLDGALDGIKFYLNPNIKRLGQMQVWADAGYQVTFSYGLGIGIHTVFASYNKFHHKTYRDCLVYAGMNTFTSFLSGFIIFSVLGFMAKQQGVAIAEVAESGPGLAFIAYPEAVAQLPGAPVWAVVFFMMLVFLGIDSQFGNVETFVAAIMDMFPRLFRINRRREVFVGVVCAGCFLLSLPMVTEGGVYVFLLVDFYVVNNTFLIIILLETLVISYAYGVDRFLDNMEMMYGIRLNLFKLCWTLLSPISIAALLTFGIITYTELTYVGKSTVYHYSDYCRIIGWLLTFSSIVFIPGVALYRLWTAQGTIQQRIQFTLKPVLKKHQLRQQDDLKHQLRQQDDLKQTDIIGQTVCDSLI